MVNDPPNFKKPGRMLQRNAAIMENASTEKEAPPETKDDPLKHCRRCEFREVCQKFCYKYFLP